MASISSFSTAATGPAPKPRVSTRAFDQALAVDMPFLQSDLSGLSPPSVGEFKRDYKGYLSAYRSFVLMRAEIFRVLEKKSVKRDPKPVPRGTLFMVAKKPSGADERKRVVFPDGTTYADAAKRGFTPAPMPSVLPVEKAKRKRAARKSRTPAQRVANIARDPQAQRDLAKRLAVEKELLAERKLKKQLARREKRALAAVAPTPSRDERERAERVRAVVAEIHPPGQRPEVPAGIPAFPKRFDAKGYKTHAAGRLSAAEQKVQIAEKAISLGASPESVLPPPIPKSAPAASSSKRAGKQRQK